MGMMKRKQQAMRGNGAANAMGMEGQFEEKEARPHSAAKAKERKDYDVD